MGNSSAKGKNFRGTSKYGQIFIQSDKQLYHPGDTVTGNIHMNIVEPFPGTKLCLKFTGKQQISYLRVVSGQKGKARSYVVSEAKDLIAQIADVYTWSSEVTVGQYTLPFSFLLPPGIPASFNQTGKGYRAYVIYKIEAFLQPTIEKDPKFKYKQAFIVKDIPLPEYSKPILKDDSFVAWGGPGCYKCYNKGNIVIRTNFDKDSYSPGEFLKVDIEIDNSQSQVRAGKVFFYLKHKMTLKAKDSTWNHEVALNHKEFPAIEAGAPVQKLSFEFRIPLANKTSTNVNKTVPSKADLRAQEDDKNSLAPVCSSLNINSVYSLEVLCLMDGWMMNFNNMIKSESPINILYPEPEAEKVAAPENWNPQIMRAYTASFAYSPEFYPGPDSNMMKNNMVSPRAVHPM